MIFVQDIDILLKRHLSKYSRFSIPCNYKFMDDLI